jgi:membrane protease YdiL (CAAX protease family)
LVSASPSPVRGEAAVPAAAPAGRAADGPAAKEVVDSAAVDPPPALGDVDRPPEAGDPEDEPRGPARKRARFKSDLWLPLASTFMPGFGQYFQGDWTGGVYTGVAVAGYLLAIQGASEIISDFGEDALEESSNSMLFSESWSYRKIVLGSLAAQGSGFLSAYSAFRSSVPRFQAEDGRYLFLGRRESIPELMAAPFRFDHLLKPSVAIPLGVLAGGVGYLVASERSDHRGARWTMSGDDFLFTGAEAWNAGVSEEAVFRGWLYPLAYQYLWQDFWLANGAQALLFGAVHYDSEANPFPWPQALLGFYFGWLAKKNGWSLSEAIFMHAWWDMILFAGGVATTYRGGDPAARASFQVDLPVRW